MCEHKGSFNMDTPSAFIAETNMDFLGEEKSLGFNPGNNRRL